MIDDAPLLTIRRRFNRPSPAELDAFAGLPTGFVVDALGGAGAIDSRIKPVGDVAAFHGVALTCDSGPGDNLAAFGALTIATKGDVIVSANGGFTGAAVIGDLMLGMFRNRGVAAFITDGSVRDIAGLRAVGLPCFAAGVTPNSPARNGPGTVGQPIVLGGIAIESGDIVVGDADGVVVVPQAKIAATIARLGSVRAAEAKLESAVQAGLEIPDFIQKLIDAGRFTEID